MTAEIWASFRALPVRVQIWVALILVPVNVASLAFVGQDWGMVIAAAANGAMLLNLPIMLVERGLSRAMAWPHLAIWTPMLGLLLWLWAGGNWPPGAFGGYLAILLVVDGISLVLDLRDAVQWLKGARAVAGRERDR